MPTAPQDQSVDVFGDLGSYRRAFVGMGQRWVHFRQAGSGPVVVMLHQSPQNSRMWLEPMRALSRSYRVLAPDLPGFGYSDTLDVAQPTIETLANGARFVNPNHDYVKLTHGRLGVRGVGPFDITITNDKITGSVDGDTRTIVVTKPDEIVRPMYHLNGQFWYAGIADDSSPHLGRTDPQFDLALGVTAGKHTIEISEWKWPDLPPSVDRLGIGEH
jgi:hypothetical protein